MSLSGIVINPLSFPKGIKKACELCAKPAHIQCKGCRVTYYCDRDHQDVDFRGIHEKICPYLIPLRTPVPILGSEEERAAKDREIRGKQMQLLEMTKTESHKKLFESQFELAIPAALQALRLAMTIYGQNSVELVPSYLLLGEASIGLKNYIQAEEYLSLAQWSILKAPDCDQELRAQLHRNFGLLYSSQGNYDEAAKNFAKDIYFSSLSQGPDHISVSGGYFQLGNVFQKQDRIPEAGALYEKVVKIWKTFVKQGSVHLDEAQEAEAVSTLKAIHAFRFHHVPAKQSSAECQYLMAQLYYHCSKLDMAQEYVKAASEVYETTLGYEHSISREIRQFHKTILNESQNKPGTSVLRRLSVKPTAAAVNKPFKVESSVAAAGISDVAELPSSIDNLASSARNSFNASAKV